MSGSIERDSTVSLDDQGKVSRQHTESYYVESATPKSTAQILDELGFLGGDPHSWDPTTPLKSVKVKQLKHRNPWRYQISLTYSNTVPDRSETEDDNPFNEEPEIRWEGGEFEQAITKDRDGNAILTPVGNPYDPPITMLVPTGRLVIVRNERVLDVDPDLNYRGRVNANSWAGKEAETLLLKTITSHRERKNGIVFFPTEYVFEWQQQGWNEEVLAQDLYERVDSARTVRIRDSDQNEVTEPWPVDEDGIAIEKANLPAQAYYQQIKKYKTAAFEAFRFPV